MAKLIQCVCEPPTQFREMPARAILRSRSNRLSPIVCEPPIEFAIPIETAGNCTYETIWFTAPYAADANEAEGVDQRYHRHLWKARPS